MFYLDQLFYIQEFRELFFKLLKDFDSTKMSKNFLRDLIEANHIFLLMLENHIKKSGVLSVMSRKKQKKQAKKKEKKPKKKESKEEKEARLKLEKEYKKRLDEQDSEFKKKIWEKSFPKIASLIQNEQELQVESDNLMPFDFTSDQELDAQKDVVIEKIQHLLVENKPDDSIALFREARFLWPADRELFGEPQIQADDEFETFKNLFMKSLEIKKPEPPKIQEEKEDEEEKSNFYIYFKKKSSF